MSRPKPQFTTELKEIALRLKQLRKVADCTQREMAERLHISLSHYSKLENGIGCLGPRLIEQITRSLQVSREWLLYGRGPEPVSVSVGEAKLRRSAQDSCCYFPDNSELLSILNLRRVEEIIMASRNEEMQELADKVAANTGVTPLKALAMLVSQLVLGSHPEKQ